MLASRARVTGTCEGGGWGWGGGRAQDDFDRMTKGLAYCDDEGSLEPEMVQQRHKEAGTQADT